MKVSGLMDQKMEEEFTFKLALIFFTVVNGKMVGEMAMVY